MVNTLRTDRDLWDLQQHAVATEQTNGLLIISLALRKTHAHKKKEKKAHFYSFSLSYLQWAGAAVCHKWHRVMNINVLRCQEN